MSKQNWASIVLWGMEIVDSVHPDDLSSALKVALIDPLNFNIDTIAKKPLAALVECICDEGEYFKVKEVNFRGELPEIFRERKEMVNFLPHASACNVGDDVEVKSKGKEVFAKITTVHWHHKKGKFYYYVSAGGVLLKKQYWPEDFQWRRA